MLERAKSVARAEREENTQRLSASVAEWAIRRQAIQEAAKRKADQAEEQATLDAVRMRLVHAGRDPSLEEWGGVDMVVQDILRTSHTLYHELQCLSNGRVVAHLPIVARWCASYWLEQRKGQPSTLALYHGTRADVVEAIAAEVGLGATTGDTSAGGKADAPTKPADTHVTPEPRRFRVAVTSLGEGEEGEQGKGGREGVHVVDVQAVRSPRASPKLDLRIRLGSDREHRRRRRDDDRVWRSSNTIAVAPTRRERVIG